MEKGDLVCHTPIEESSKEEASECDFEEEIVPVENSRSWIEEWEAWVYELESEIRDLDVLVCFPFAKNIYNLRVLFRISQVKFEKTTVFPPIRSMDDIFYFGTGLNELNIMQQDMNRACVLVNRLKKYAGKCLAEQNRKEKMQEDVD